MTSEYALVGALGIPPGNCFPVDLYDPEEIQLPSNCFGVFVTLRRKYRPEDDHQTMNEKIHGCVGWWSQDFHLLSPLKILNTIQEVALQASEEDNRRSRFEIPWTQDEHCVLEVDCMCHPLVPVDPQDGTEQTGKPFLSSRYGLLITSTESPGKRATFLPNVFPDSYPWPKLLLLLQEKAGISPLEKFKLWSYPVVQTSDFVYNILNDHILMKPNVFETIRFQYQEFLRSTSRNKFPFVPYSVDVETGKVVFQSSQLVRNCAVLADLCSFLPLSEAQELVLSFEKHYHQEPDFLQGFSFLLSFHPNPQKWIPQFQKRLQDPGLELTFEKNQILLGLCRQCLSSQKPSLILADELFPIDPSDLFEWNWILQAIHACKSFTGATTQILEDGFEFLVESVSQMGEMTETNGLVVAFETLSTFLLPAKGSEKRWDPRFHACFLSLWSLIEKRRLPELGIPFLRENSARADMWSHYMNGWNMIQH